MPPLLSRLLAHLRPAIVGYDHDTLITSVFRRTIAYYPQRFNPDTLGAETILDFGGGFGIHEKECYISTTTRWAIVETPAVCKRARMLETSHLRWFPTIPLAAQWLGPIDLIHCNGALQYSNASDTDLLKLLDLRAKRILWRRMVFAKSTCCIEYDTQTSYLCDNGPQGTPFRGPHLRVRYPITYLPKKAFLVAHTKRGYTLTSCTTTDFDFTLKDTP